MANPTNTWTENEGALHAVFKFKDFAQAFSFITHVALLAQKSDHHPEWSQDWGTVKIKLTTVSEGRIVTQKDRDLARQIDAILQGFPSTH